MTPSANIGIDNGLFEPVHGSAPDIAGKGIANPAAMILSTVMMLENMGDLDNALKIEQALIKVLKEGKFLTPDLGGKSKTIQMAKAICSKLKTN